MTLTPAGAETANLNELRFYQVKSIDAGRFGGIEFGSSAASVSCYRRGYKSATDTF